MVSIILNTYNDSELLMPAIDSCFEQDVPVELILVDDASTKPLVDEVSKLIWEDGKINYIRHNENKGLSAGRNTGIEAAKYDLVIPLDADDHFFPNVLGKMVATFSENTDIVYGNLWTNGFLDYPCAQPFSKDLMKRVNPLFSSSMFRKRIWEKVGGYLVRKGPHYEDWHFWNKCFVAGAKFKYADTVVYEHSERGGSMLRKLERQRSKYIKIATAPLYGLQDIEEEETINLHLGCGNIHIDDFVNVDIGEKPEVDVVDNIKTLEKFSDNSVKLIYACHVLEHFGHGEIPDILNRWYDLLIPGGELRISVPDIDRIVNIYKNNWDHFQTPGNSPWVGLIFGGQRDEYDYHKTGFNFCWLKYLLEEAGFRGIEEYDHEPHWLGMYDSSMANEPFKEFVSLNIKAFK